MTEMPRWSVVVAAVTPRGSQPPTIDRVGRLRASQIEYSEQLNQPGNLDVTVAPDTLSPSVAARLVDPYLWTELEVYDPTGVLRWAGRYDLRDSDLNTWQLSAGSHEALLAGAGIYTDLDYRSTDQTSIVASLINHHQQRSHLGIDTSQADPTGRVRDRTYLLHEAGHISELVGQLADTIDGFDWWITPDRFLQVAYPARGIDRSTEIVFRRPQIVDAAVVASSSTDDCISEVLAIGVPEDQDAAPLLSLVHNDAAVARIGRRRATVTFDGVSEQATLDAHAEAVLEAGLGALYMPAGRLLTVAGTDVDAFDVGDTVGWRANTGVGVEQYTRQIVSRTVTIDETGVTQQVEFA